MNENLLKTLAVGLLGTAALVLLGPSVAASAKPVVKRGIKAAVKGYAQSMEALAELQELAEDAYAEAWAELQEEAASKPQSSASAPPVAAESAFRDEEPVIEPKRKRRTRS